MAVDDLLATLAERLGRLEDQLAIHRLVMSHPFGADTNSVGFLQSLYAADGELDLGERDPERHAGDAEGVIKRAQMIEAANSPEFNALIASGAAHVSSAPVVELNGDQATAWNYTQLLGFEQGSFRVRRVVANRWEMRREQGGWRVVRRTLRLINGSTRALDVLRGAVDSLHGAA
jgi:hypothetical protein